MCHKGCSALAGVLATLLCPRPVELFAHDIILPNHVPKQCDCAAWSSNRSSTRLFESVAAASAAARACAIPANGATPDLALPEYSPQAGWCLCTNQSAAAQWYTFCQPPAAAPSQINLLVVNATSLAVNWATNDGGARSGCVAEAELRLRGSGSADATLISGFSTRYRDSSGSRLLSYHHATLHGLQERTEYEYRVRASSVSVEPQGTVTWKRTTGIKWCSGENYPLDADPWGYGFADKNASKWCPNLPPAEGREQMVARCEAVCAAPNALGCEGFTFYPEYDGGVHPTCCFRADTSSKPPDSSSTAVCYEKEGGAQPCDPRPSAWSDWFGFRSLYAGNGGGPTKLALYADMGVFVAFGGAPPVESLPHGRADNIGNLQDDLAEGRIDWAIHSGDHAYEFEVGGGARGDGYMDSYAQFLAHAPWAPGWGNHEYLEEDRGNRLANIAAGLIAERRSARRGTTRMFYSVDVGLLHVLHLDLSPYWCRFSGCVGVDTCGVPDEWIADATSADPVTRYNFSGYRDAILAFVREDLTAVDRSETPWVLVTAHYPLYETYDNTSTANQEREAAKPDRGARGGGDVADGIWTVPNASKAQALLDFEPLLAEFAVDFFFAGHDHNYETTWPVYKGRVVGERSYTDPQAPIHILSGTAGPPEWDDFEPDGREWTREPRLVVNSYSRLTLYNASVAAFEQVANGNASVLAGTVVDSFTVVQRRPDRSAPFACFWG